MKLFLDSGAFSAWTNSTTIDIQEYIRFIKENESVLEVYACLDDITNPDKTWENQKIMEKAGLSPLPVYHVEEKEKYLRKAMEYEYFAVGGMALKGRSARREHFNYAFRRICLEENDFIPTHRIHGFGLASPDLLISYPWFSADTSSWAQYGRFGLILIPRYLHGRCHYDKPPHVLTVSFRSKAIGDVKHFRNLGISEKKWITEYCLSKGCPMGRTLFREVEKGYSLKENEHFTDRNKKDRVECIVDKGLCCDGEMRDRLNLMYFLDLEKNQPKWPWAWRNEENPLFPPQEESV